MVFFKDSTNILISMLEKQLVVMSTTPQVIDVDHSSSQVNITENTFLIGIPSRYNGFLWFL